MSGTVIVYVLTTQDAEQVAEWLNLNGVSAKAYHSEILLEGIESSDRARQHLEAALLNNEVKVLVATTALGMGYDKPDLGFVVHYQAPGSIINYYQQIGRAGRGIDRAIGVLLAGIEDEQIHDYFQSTAFPNETQVLALLAKLDNSEGMSECELEATINLRSGQISKALRFLAVENPAPVLKDGPRWKRTPVDYRLDHSHIARLTHQREIEWEEVQRYINCQGCLMVFLARAMDDERATACGKCASCSGDTVVPVSYSRQLELAALRFLCRSETPLECKKQVAAEAFSEYGFRGNLPQVLRAETGRVLARWGDAGWGGMVLQDKHSNHFRHELVTAVAEMIQERWNPAPFPAWVTCVPSDIHPELVSNFSRRLAEALKLPFVKAVTKARENQPQKFQQNRYFQCHNLDGAFAVAHDIPGGPVLLVDDIVDSGWTITIVGALLKQAGSGPVWPVALARASAAD